MMKKIIIPIPGTHIKDMQPRKHSGCAHLGGDVVRRATEGGGGHSVHDALLAHAEVCQLTVSLRVQQDVVQLQIPGGGKKGGVESGTQSAPSGFHNARSCWAK